MHIWCIKTGIVLVLQFNPWVEASAGGLKVVEASDDGLKVPEGLYSPVANYFGTCLRIKI
jgi:hypothetical protein